MASGGQKGNRIILALSVEQVVQRRPNGYGECLACGQRGFLTFELGTLWQPRKGSSDLIHVPACPVNRFVMNQHPQYKSNATIAWREKRKK
jgi:hypothetical protein